MQNTKPLEVAVTSTERDRIIFPNEIDIAAAAESSRQIAAFLSIQAATHKIDFIDETQRRELVELPALALRLLEDILSELALGNAVKVVPIHTELTTQEAADLLSVSRPHLVKLLEAGVIPHTKIGNHRRVKFTDVMTYKAQREESALEAMDKLARQAQEVGMGY
jgi:excisionase family DNA binding protein